ncbi:DUF3857 and transglutaminase domain-containing protein [bacterium]|nr:DUF3857 and transglutaminase domain-containing protein [bacterium]
MKIRTWTRALALLLLPALGLSARPLAAADTAAAEIMARLNAVDAAKYPDANAVVLESRRDVKYNADGTYLDRSYELVKVLTEPGKENYGEAGFDYTRQYDAVRIEMARVIKADGRVVDVPAEMIKDVTHPALAQMNIYDANARVQMVTFPNLEVGDAIEYSVLDSCFLPPIEGQYDLIEVFQSGDPILFKQVRVDGPAERPLHHLVKDGALEFKTAGKDGRVSYEWTARDVQRIVEEPAMPSLLSFAPRVLASTLGSWNEVSRWWCDMTGKFRVQDDSLRAITHALTDTLTTDDAKILAIYHFVAQKIRYMGLGTGKKAGFEPKPATETLSTRYGVCRDVAVLMATMLDVVGIKSYVVLTRAGEKIDSEIPTIAFNHAIVALPDGKGGFYFADPTVENTVDLLLTVEADASMLVCTPEGVDLQTSAHSPARDNLGSISARTRVDAAGKLTSEVTVDTRGIYDTAFRGWCKRYQPRQLANFWQQVITRVHPGAVLTGFSTSDPEDLYHAFGIKFSYEIDKYAVQAGNYLLVRSPVATNSFELILRQFLADAGLPERNYTFDLGVTLGSEQKESLVLPAGWHVKSLPSEVDLSSGPLSYDMNYNSSKGGESTPGLTVDYSKQFLIDSKQLDPAQYLELKKILRTSSRSGRGEIILERDGKSAKGASGASN